MQKPVRSLVPSARRGEAGSRNGNLTVSFRQPTRYGPVPPSQWKSSLPSCAVLPGPYHGYLHLARGPQSSSSEALARRTRRRGAVQNCTDCLLACCHCLSPPGPMYNPTYKSPGFLSWGRAVHQSTIYEMQTTNGYYPIAS
ncbi:hypothetical protein CCHR01_16483 [Colletotrichum chrysophilum]|uniref:Uncharacterized protein n=1 Tax=Colletotrichum chrysophilum TaxID=1836956 RepID=A0AAD9EDF1_9PEZI|nr:hypothetical protein CCHR01_16483 [Colletotrichum chrysophilum]